MSEGNFSVFRASAPPLGGWCGPRSNDLGEGWHRAWWGSDVYEGSLGREAGMSNRPPSFAYHLLHFFLLLGKHLQCLGIVELFYPYVFCRHLYSSSSYLSVPSGSSARTTRTSGQYTMELVQHGGQQALTIRARKLPFLDFEETQ